MSSSSIGFTSVVRARGVPASAWIQGLYGVEGIRCPTGARLEERSEQPADSGNVVADGLGVKGVAAHSLDRPEQPKLDQAVIGPPHTPINTPILSQQQGGGWRERSACLGRRGGLNRTPNNARRSTVGDEYPTPRREDRPRPERPTLARTRPGRPFPLAIVTVTGPDRRRKVHLPLHRCRAHTRARAGDWTGCPPRRRADRDGAWSGSALGLRTRRCPRRSRHQTWI